MEKKDKKELPSKRRIMLYAAMAFAVAVFGIAMLLFGSQGGIGACSYKLLPQTKYACYLSMAEQNSNASICLKMTDPYATKCVMAFAVNSSSISACKVLGTSVAVNACIAFVGESTGNASACIMVKNQSCIYSIASSRGFDNYSLCNYLSGINGTICSSVYYFKRALKEESPQACSSVSSNSSLLGTIIDKSMQNQSFDLKDSIYGYYNITPTEFCVIEVANESRNANLCKGLQGIAGSICMSAFVNKSVTQNLNESMCGKLNGSTKQLCIASIDIEKALSTNNLSICMLPKMGNFTNACIASLAEKEKNISMCNLINESYSNIRAACYETINSSS